MMSFELDAPLSDTDIAAAIGRELNRQANQIELIASENIVSTDVLKAQGSVLTNKYAEGYPGRRASMSTRSRRSPSSGPRRSSRQASSTCNPIPARRPTRSS